MACALPCMCRGFWEAGVPVGPFRSRETGSASGFVCLRVAITTNRGREVLTCLPRPEVCVAQGVPQQPPETAMHCLVAAAATAPQHPCTQAPVGPQG